MGMHEPVRVETWEWADTVNDGIVLHGYDAEGDLVATRTFEFVETEAKIDGEWETVEEAAAGDGASWDPDESLGEPRDYFDPRNFAYECTDCEAGHVRTLGGPEPPDPDFHGNRSYGYTCPDCGERFSVTDTPRGGRVLPAGLQETGLRE